VGASAGLNLRWDHFGYRHGGRTWGNPASPVRFDDVYEVSDDGDGGPPLDQPADVVDRRGCDRSPIDPTADEGRLTLLSFVWPDQRARIAQLEAAIEVARRVPVVVDRTDAVTWLEVQLAGRRPGVATVVYHSIVMQYLPRDDRAEVVRLLSEAGARAGADAPLAWLRFEPGGDRADIHLTLWPGGDERHLARAGFHGRQVTWLGS
jgi:hypothetical protein